MSLIFIGFALLQYNDPDHLLWIAVYTYAATINLIKTDNNFFSVMLTISTVLLSTFLGAQIYLTIAGEFSSELLNESLGLGVVVANTIYIRHANTMP